MKKHIGCLTQNKSVISIIMLMLLALLAINGYYSFWATRHTLTSPAIPQKMVDFLSFPNLYIGMILTPAIFTSFLLHIKKKNVASILISMTGVIFHVIYYQYALYRFLQDA